MRGRVDRKEAGRKSPVVMAGLLVLCAALIACAASPRAQDTGAVPQSGGTPAPMELPHLPRVTIRALPGYGVAPLTVGFLVQNANPESAPFVSYRWNFGDGTVSNLPPQGIFHTYKNAGSYVVTVTATNSDGLNASGFAGVIVRPRGQQ
jgi:PKD repeat protein